MLHSPDDDSRLTPDQRRREVASILARGILRLAPRPELRPMAADPGPESMLPSPPRKPLRCPPRPALM